MPKQNALTAFHRAQRRENDPHFVDVEIQKDQVLNGLFTRELRYYQLPKPLQHNPSGDLPVADFNQAVYHVCGENERRWKIFIDLFKTYLSCKDRHRRLLSTSPLKTLEEKLKAPEIIRWNRKTQTAHAKLNNEFSEALNKLNPTTHFKDNLNNLSVPVPVFAAHFFLASDTHSWFWQYVRLVLDDSFVNPYLKTGPDPRSPEEIKKMRAEYLALLDKYKPIIHTYKKYNATMQTGLAVRATQRLFPNLLPYGSWKTVLKYVTSDGHPTAKGLALTMVGAKHGIAPHTSECLLWPSK